MGARRGLSSPIESVSLEHQTGPDSILAEGRPTALQTDKPLHHNHMAILIHLGGSRGYQQLPFENPMLPAIRYRRR